jgi:hypothetical protein
VFHATMTRTFYCCRLTDFGLARMLDLNKSHVSTKSFGTTSELPVWAACPSHDADPKREPWMAARACLAFQKWLCRRRHHPLHAA